MPLVYADTSALFPFFYPHDDFSAVVTAAVQRTSPDFVYWSFMRFELRHNLRQVRTDADGETAWQALRAAECTKARFQWQPGLKCELVLELAEQLSDKFGLTFPAGSADFLHVAAARQLTIQTGIEAFWTCDRAQAKAAKAAGLRVRLFSQSSGGRRDRPN